MSDEISRPRLLHPLEIYLEHLTIIGGVSLTQREIDVISCFLNMNGRTRQHIANFLSISLKTVNTHINNAKQKFGCNINSMMTLLEKSECFIILKEDYYLSLLRDSLFKKSLKEIAPLTIDKKLPSGVLIYWKKKPPFLEILENNLMGAGLTVSLENRQEVRSFDQIIQEDYHDLFQVYFLPDKFLEKQEIAQEECSSNPKIFFLHKTVSSMDATQEISKFICINASEWHSYYFSVFVILKKIISTIDLDKIFAKFEEKASGLQNFSDSSSNQNYLKRNVLDKEGGSAISKTENFLRNKRGIISIFSLLITFGFCCLEFLNFKKNSAEERRSQSYKQEEQPRLSARSDLIVPMESVLLGRSELMRQIEEKFKGQEGIRIVALTGIGGSGKTTIARQYARTQKLPLIWEINAETKGSLVESFERLAYAILRTEKDKKELHELIEIKNAPEREKKLLEFVKAQLKLYSNWFLIYDNVEKFIDIQKYFPLDSETWGNGKVILTTRDSNVQNNKYVKETLPIGELDDDQKMGLFTKIMTHGTRSPLTAIQTVEAKKFLVNIPPFPLDVSIASYYIKISNIPYGEYLENLKTSHIDFIRVQEEFLKESGEDTKTRYTIVTLTLQKIIESHKDFLDLLLFMSLLDSQNIPKDLFYNYKGHTISDNFIYNLKKYSLVINLLLPPRAPESHISIHRSAQDISFFYLNNVLKLTKNSSLLKRIVYILDDYVDQAIEQESFPKMQIMMRHLDKFLSYSGLLSDFFQGLLESKLVCMYYFFDDNNCRQAIKIGLERLKRQSPDSLSSEDNLRIARSFVHIGAVCTELRLYKEAQESLEKGIEIYGKDLLNNRIELSWALTHLGNIYRRLGDYEKARDCLEESMHLNKQYGADKKRIIRTLSCLGSVYRGLGWFCRIC